MKTTLLYSLKNKIRKLFGLRQLYTHPKSTPKDVKLRMDLIDHIVNDNRREEFETLFNIKDVRNELVDGKLPQTVKEEFNSLPISRLSEKGMLEVIRIVKLDIEQQAQNFQQYIDTSSVESVLDMVGDEMEKTIK